MSITFFFVADVKCGLCEINENNRANATHGLTPVHKMFRDRTKAMLDRRDPRARTGPVPTLLELLMQRHLDSVSEHFLGWTWTMCSTLVTTLATYVAKHTA